jgi:enterochelin esterase-like enzyme
MVIMHNILLRAQTAGTPLIDGEIATFVWHGKRPPVMIGDFTNWEDGSPQTFKRLSKGLWACSLTFPADAYLEYTFLLDGERLLDPYNPRTTPNGLGKINQYFYMPAGSPTTLTQRNDSIPHGSVTRHVVLTKLMDLVVGRQRVVHLYQPPVSDPVPLVVVWDGVDYLRRIHLPVIVDNLIAQGRICPLALAMIQNAGRARIVEYACSDPTLGFLTQSILPLARSNLRLSDPRQGNFGMLGASMGGLMGLYAGMRLPHIFSNVLSQSGAFGSDDYEPVVYDLIRHTPVKPLKIWMDVGTYDFPEIRASNRSMAALLQKCGYTVTLRQHNAGHNFPAWRDDVWRGLEWLYHR